MFAGEVSESHDSGAFAWCYAETLQPASQLGGGTLLSWITTEKSLDSRGNLTSFTGEFPISKPKWIPVSYISIGFSSRLLIFNSSAWNHEFCLGFQPGIVSQVNSACELFPFPSFLELIDGSQLGFHHGYWFSTSPARGSGHCITPLQRKVSQRHTCPCHSPFFLTILCRLAVLSATWLGYLCFYSYPW